MRNKNTICATKLIIVITMAKQTSSNLLVLTKLNKNKAVEQNVVEQANLVIEQCRIRLSLVNDEDVKRKLNLLISQTGDILRSLIEKDKPDDIKEKVYSLQMNALSLPSKLQRKTSLNAVSLNVVKACVFLLAFSLALCLGAVFHAWYYAYLTMEVFLNAVVNLLAFDAIPVASLGLFAYSIYQSTNEQEKDVPE